MWLFKSDSRTFDSLTKGQVETISHWERFIIYRSSMFLISPKVTNPEARPKECLRPETRDWWRLDRWSCHFIWDVVYNIFNTGLLQVSSHEYGQIECFLVKRDATIRKEQLYLICPLTSGRFFVRFMLESKGTSKYCGDRTTNGSTRGNTNTPTATPIVSSRSAQWFMIYFTSDAD